jgi:phosphocarrier protein
MPADLHRMSLALQVLPRSGPDWPSSDERARRNSMAQAEAKVVLTNKMGLHARPSTQIATTASRFASDVQIAKDDMVVDAKSVLELLMLAAECGTQLTITANGDDAKAAVQALAELVESRFGELDVDA